ncbi:MAG: TonB-dependent receptor plug domain-containing protein, partial [Bacteroidota bacterium]
MGVTGSAQQYRTHILYSMKHFFLLCGLLLNLPMAIYAQELQVEVVDEQKQPLSSVLIYTDDYSFSTTTDAEGKALLNKAKDTTYFNFQYLGYGTQRITLAELRQKNQVQLQASITELSTAVLIGRRDDKAVDIPYQIETVGHKAIMRTNAQTSADVLRDHANVFVQKSQMGGGSPIIRGFEANRVLLVVDGVRMNNAIYRSGHLQNAITVNPNALERLEVIYGPGSLTYGSDALGGVVHFRTRLPQLSLSDKANTQLTLSSRYASANNERTFSTSYNFGRKKWAAFTNINISDFGDLRAGRWRADDSSTFGERPYYVATNFTQTENFDTIVENDKPALQVGTAYRQIDILQKYLFQVRDTWKVIANFQYSTSTDVPRYDQLSELGSNNPTDLRFAEWYYGPQERWLASLQVRLSKPNKWYDRASVIGAYQHISEDRYKRRLYRTARTFNLEDVTVWSATADFDKYLSQDKRQNLSYGVEVNYNQVRSEAGNEDIFTGAITSDAVTRYPSGGSTMTTWAAYANYHWNSRDSIWKAQGGLRYTFVDTYSL